MDPKYLQPEVPLFKFYYYSVLTSPAVYNCLLLILVSVGQSAALAMYEP